MKKSFQIFRATIFFCLLALLILSTDVLAQPRGRAMPDSSQIAAMFDSLAIKISLADSQKIKVREIFFASFDETRKAFENNRGDFQAMREARNAVTEKRDKGIKALLTDEQEKTYDKYIKEEQERQRSRFRGRRGGRGN